MAKTNTTLTTPRSYYRVQVCETNMPTLSRGGFADFRDANAWAQRYARDNAGPSTVSVVAVLGPKHFYAAQYAGNGMGGVLTLPGKIGEPLA